MNIILPVIHYAQRFWEKILEPGISSDIIKFTMSSVREMPFSFTEDMAKFITYCKDEEYLEEMNEFHSEIFQNQDLLKVYLDCIFGLLQKYCKDNNIQMHIEDYTFKILLRW
jgi:hypothetical protein